MAGERTRYQEGIIRRYYRNLDALRAQRLQDLVGDIYLASSEKRRVALWAKAGELLAATGMPADELQQVLAARDIEALAAVVNARS
ncbi:MAG: hypothetical protein ACKOSS_08845 [Planctomycetia bacterium]